MAISPIYSQYDYIITQGIDKYLFDGGGQAAAREEEDQINRDLVNCVI